MTTLWGNKNLTYITITKSYEDVQIKTNTLLRLNFQVDENVITTVRTVYNIIDALTSTGGFASIIMFLFKIFTFRV